MIKIMFDQDAIEEALTNYIGEVALGVDLSHKTVEIKFTPGRGKNGLRAEVNISDNGAQLDFSSDEPTPAPENDVSLTEDFDTAEAEVDLTDEPVLGPFD